MPATKNIDASLRHRQELNKLLAINPNYFGNLDDTPFTANLEIIQDTAFEEVELRRLQPRHRCPRGDRPGQAPHRIRRRPLQSREHGVGPVPHLLRRGHDVGGRRARLVQRPRRPGLRGLPQGQDQAADLHRRVPAERRQAQALLEPGPALGTRDPLVAGPTARGPAPLEPDLGQPPGSAHPAPAPPEHLPRRRGTPRDRSREDPGMVREGPAAADPRTGPGAVLAGAGCEGCQAGQGASAPVRHAAAGRACRRPASRTSPCFSPRPSSSRPSTSTWAT